MVRSNAQINDLNENDHDCSYIKQQLTEKVAQKRNTINHYDIKYHRMQWKVDPAEAYIKGSVTTYFVPRESNFDSIDFDLATSMTVDSVIYRDKVLTFGHQHDLLVINLGDTLLLNELDSITVYYQGEPDSTGFGAFVSTSHNNVPLLWTLSEPYGAKEWWPCKQSLTDKIDSVDLFVQVPQGNVVASNGLLKSEIVSGEDLLFHWKHNYPITAYLIAIAVTNYQRLERLIELNNGIKIPMVDYKFPEDETDMEQSLALTTDFMNLFTDLFGPYPFLNEKYGHAQFNLSGGMEHQTMSFMGNFGFELQAHELAHQWFGNKLTCNSWKEIWLNEGFATYSTGLCYEFLNDFYWYSWRKQTIAKIVSEDSGTVIVNDTSDFKRIFDSRLSYAKAAYVLHMLRWKLGDDAFFDAVSNYVQDQRFIYDFVETGDLMEWLEQAYGNDLDEFFNDWVYNHGFPSYQVYWEQDNSNLTIIIGQYTSHVSVDFFEMPVSLTLYHEGVDTSLVLNNDYNEQVFELEIPFTVDSVVFDKDLWLISKDNLVVNSLNPLVEKDDLVFSISPNPVSDVMKIYTSGSGGELVVYNYNGVKLDQLILEKSNLNYYNMSELAHGLYLLQYHHNGSVLNKRVLKY